jgi:hypothetical protein
MANVSNRTKALSAFYVGYEAHSRRLFSSISSLSRANQEGMVLLHREMVTTLLNLKFFCALNVIQREDGETANTPCDT